MIICGPGSEQIGMEIAGILGMESSIVKHKFFPDGETHLRLTREVDGVDVVLVHSTSPPQDRHLVQLLLLVDAIREGGAESITLVAPYMAYARQDRRRLPGEAVSVFTVIRLLTTLGVLRLVTVNVHNPAVFEGHWLEFIDLSAMPLLAEHLKDSGFGGAFSLSLGKKPIDLEHAKEAASILDGEYGCLETFRDPNTGDVSLGRANIGVEGLRVVVFDDVITTGGTHLKAVESLRDGGASEVHLACVHSLLSKEKLLEVLEATDSFICTDTVPNRCSRVRVAPLIADALR